MIYARVVVFLEFCLCLATFSAFEVEGGSIESPLLPQSGIVR